MKKKYHSITSSSAESTFPLGLSSSTARAARRDLLLKRAVDLDFEDKGSATPEMEVASRVFIVPELMHAGVRTLIAAADIAKEQHEGYCLESARNTTGCASALL